MSYQVYIAYRREGGDVLARMLHDQLCELNYRVFYDVESLDSGPFDKKLFQFIDECTDVLVVLSPGSLDRCSDPEDWIRAEIAYSLKTGKNVIPVMMRGFSFSDTELPEDIKDLKIRNGLEANMELFPASMEKLTKKLMHSKPDGRYRPDVKKTADHPAEIPMRMKIGGAVLLLVLLVPYYAKYFYSEQEYLPSWINQFLMGFKEFSSLHLVILYFVLIGIIEWEYNRSLPVRRALQRLSALELSDFEYRIDEFVRILIEKEDAGKLEISSEPNGIKKDGMEYFWSAERKGMSIRSVGGERPDYMILNFEEYEGNLNPLYLNRMVTKSSSVILLRDQGFELVWQKEKRACYKYGNWKLLLSFGGLFHRLLVLELMHGERNSLLEKQTLDAEKIMFETEMKNLAEDAKKEWKQFKTDLDDLKKEYKTDKAEGDEEPKDDRKTEGK